VTLKICELVSLVPAVLVAGMFFGPWVALTRSMRAFSPEMFLAVVDRLNRNMALVMTVLMPVALLAIVPVLALSYGAQRGTFYLALAAFALFVVALLVTVIVEVPIVQQIGTWTIATLPANWQQLRDRWGAFHLVRIASGLGGLFLLLLALIF
jgi:uncharacterized membrane protein